MVSIPLRIICKRMDEQLIFKKGLQAMRKRAARKGNKVSIHEILDCFPGLELDREQIQMIYDYAEEEGITIEDYKLHDTRSVTVGDPELTGEDKAYFQMYLEDLKGVEPCDEEEQAMLLERLVNGEDEVIARLTEGNLHMVLETARQHSGQGILIGDLVQEGNIALMMALSDLASGQMLMGSEADLLRRRVDEAMQAQLEEQASYRKAGNAMARETNRLIAAALELEDELGREATLSELSKKVELPEDKVQELIRVSLNAAEYANNDDAELQDGEELSQAAQEEDLWGDEE